MSVVSIKKYDKLLKKVQEWSIFIKELETSLEHVELRNEELNTEKEELYTKYIELKKHKGDSNRLCELEDENNELKNAIKLIKNQHKEENEQEYKNTFILQKDVMLKDGKIQQLQDTVESLKQRYKDLYEEYRDQRKWNRDVKDREIK